MGANMEGETEGLTPEEQDIMNEPEESEEEGEEF